MINPKRLIALAKKWQKKAAIKRRRISFPTKRTPNEGHFVVYTIDKKRFVVPLEHLKHEIFGELFRMSEEEFGLPVDGPITLPCDGAFMEFVISCLVRRTVSEESMEIALLICPSVDATAADSHRCLSKYSALHQKQMNHHIFLQSF